MYEFVYVYAQLRRFARIVDRSFTMFATNMNCLLLKFLKISIIGWFQIDLS